MARDKVIDSLTTEAQEDSAPVTRHDVAEVMDVSLVREMMMKMQMEAGEQLGAQLAADVEHTREVQEELLFEMLDSNKDTPYGREHGFADIKSVEEFKKLPYTTYDDYAGYIYEVMEHGTRGVVTTEEIVHFNETSGTMGNPKGIPYTKRMAEILMGYSGAFTISMAAKELGGVGALTRGRAFCTMEGHVNTLKSGITFGSLSCKATSDNRQYLSATTTSPDAAVFAKAGTDTRYLHARYAVAEKSITEISCVFITNLLDLMRYVEDRWQMLVHDIETGTIDPSIQLPDDVRAQLEGALKPMPERAAELRQIFEGGFDAPVASLMWPQLVLIRSVAGGGFAPYTERLRRFLGDGVHLLYTGYSASEGAFSVPFELDNPSSVFLPRSVYFEFVSVENPDYDHTLGLEDLEEGKDYEVIITSRSGFYRYKMRDAIHVTGHRGTCPTMEFLYRLDQTVNMKGEKTTEAVLRGVADRVSAHMGLDLVDFSVYPDVDVHPPRYEFLYEFYHADHDAIDMDELSRVTDEELRAGNYDVDYMTEDGDFAPASALVLNDETNQLWVDMLVMRGKAPNQIKPVHIIDTEQKRRFFYALVDHDVRA